MRSNQRFATAHPLLFAVLATVAWILVMGAAAAIAAWALQTPVADPRPQSLGMLAATACLLGVMRRCGWLRAAGIASLGNWRMWLATVGLALYLVIVYQLAFFRGIAIDLSNLWGSGGAQSILMRQAVVGVAEETMFRGFLLYALVRVWGDSRRGLLAALAVPALIFGLAHAPQVLAGDPMDDTLMTMLNCTVSGLWWGALVLVGGSLWPAVLLHAASNASFQITALGLGGIDATVADYAAATAAELPLVIAGFWLLLRKVPGSIPTGRRGRAGKASAAARTIIGMVLALSLTGTLFLTGCAGETASTPTRAPNATTEVETRLTAAERAAILDAAWQTVNDKYFDPTFGGKDWTGAIGVVQALYFTEPCHIDKLQMGNTMRPFVVG